jgi:hypothetical protein
VDWLLAAHQVAPLQYEMGGFWNPISVRDQMVRGQELARRAINAGLIDAHRRLIVVGAGAGGMAAALTTHRAGFPVIVIERGVRPFDRQLRTATRTIYPYLYDWPHDRHEGVDLAPPAAIQWKEDHADGAGRQWIRALAGLRLVAFSSSVTPPPSGGPPIVVGSGAVNVHVTTLAGIGWLHGGMLLSSVGFGTETTSVSAARSSTYHGWWFWERDTIGSTNLAAPRPPDVVIAGGGDGALQDTVRLLLRPPFENFRDLLAALPIIPAHIRLAISDADDTATRAWLWSTSSSDDCPILTELHRRVNQVVDDWWRADRSNIAAALDPLWRQDVSSVHLVHPCMHFGRSFALNRFLVLLLERAATERKERELAAREKAMRSGEIRTEQAAPQFWRIQNHRLASVDGRHACAATRPCPGPHDAVLVVATCATAPATAAAPLAAPSLAADLIILRGGVGPPVTPLALSPIANRRQYLPDRPR